MRHGGEVKITGAIAICPLVLWVDVSLRGAKNSFTCRCFHGSGLFYLYSTAICRLFEKGAPLPIRRNLYQTPALSASSSLILDHAPSNQFSMLIWGISF